MRFIIALVVLFGCLVINQLIIQKWNLMLFQNKQLLADLELLKLRVIELESSNPRSYWDSFDFRSTTSTDDPLKVYIEACNHMHEVIRDNSEIDTIHFGSATHDHRVKLMDEARLELHKAHYNLMKNSMTYLD